MTRTKGTGKTAPLLLQLIAMGSIAFSFGRASTRPNKNRAPQTIDMDWDKVLCVSKTNTTLQVVVTPLVSTDSPLHGQVWSALNNLNAPFVPCMPWLPYPRLAVAELEPSTKATTSWDSSLIDSHTTQLFEPDRQRPNIVNLSTIPAWMLKAKHPVSYSSGLDKPEANYTQGTELRDPSM
jgi:hypothetical protein